MNDMSWGERFIVAAIVAILLFVGIHFFVGVGKFKDACVEASGTTVWDGRQYQCIKK